MTKIRVLFVCLGNICRSPMAEFVMKDLARRAGREAEFQIASAGTASFNTGRPVYPEAARMLNRHGISCAGFAARQIRREDFFRYDYIIGMDSANIRDMEDLRSKALRDGGTVGEIRRLLDYTDRPGDVADPWYTGDFDAAWRDIEAGCRGLLERLV